MPAASERLAWAAEVIDPAPGDRILEVGCGHGVLVHLLAARLDGGAVVGVDRSATMIAAAMRRNRSAVEAGVVRLVEARLTEADLGARVFDVVVSFDVRAFWTPSAPEWAVVRRVLAPRGRVVVGYSLMTPQTHDATERAVRELAPGHGLEVSTVHRGATRPFGSAAVELRAASRTD